jgi:HD-like signal output (HDOD) protein
MSTVAPDISALVTQTVKKVTTIATLPEVTLQIIKTVEDPRSTAAQLHKIVAHDPALVTRILKVVNSAFYGLPGQIGSIERAIVMLGLNAVKNIAVAASLGQLFRGVKLCDGFTAKDLWTHCVGVGVSAREIAKLMKLPLAEEAFLAGMIHDIGILVELQTAPEQLSRVCQNAREGHGDFCALERAMTGMDHQMLGQKLAELWKFPLSCQLVAGHHHHPMSLAGNDRLLVAIVHVADTICCQSNIGFNLTSIDQKLDDVGLAEHKIDMAIIQKVKEDLPNLIQNASAMFS